MEYTQDNMSVTGEDAFVETDISFRRRKGGKGRRSQNTFSDKKFTVATKTEEYAKLEDEYRKLVELNKLDKSSISRKQFFDLENSMYSELVNTWNQKHGQTYYHYVIVKNAVDEFCRGWLNLNLLPVHTYEYDGFTKRDIPLKEDEGKYFAYSWVDGFVTRTSYLPQQYLKLWDTQYLNQTSRNFNQTNYHLFSWKDGDTSLLPNEYLSVCSTGLLSTSPKKTDSIFGMTEVKKQKREYENTNEESNEYKPRNNYKRKDIS